MDIKYGDHVINFDLTTLKENEIPVKILVPGPGCNSSPEEETILKQIKLKGDSNES